MEKHAVVKGEVHVSKTDRNLLFSRNLSDHQVLYMEGRSDVIRLHKNTNSYFLYLIGYFTLKLLYISAAYIHSAYSSDEYDVERKAHNHGLEFEDEIDLEIHEIYESYNPRLRRWLPIALAVFFFVLLYGAFNNKTFNFFGISTGIPYWIFPLIMGMFIPFIYSGLLLILGGGRDRDEKMAATINSLSESRNHDQILVLVGDRHVNAISDNLKNHGWNVTRERSNHWLARIRQLLPE